MEATLPQLEQATGGKELPGPQPGMGLRGVEAVRLEAMEEDGAGDGDSSGECGAAGNECGGGRSGRPAGRNAEREAKKAKELAPYIEAALARKPLMQAPSRADTPVVKAAVKASMPG